MKQKSSSRRVNEQARQILADIMLFEISDPVLRDATITGCEVSFDRSYCNVFYTANPDSYEETAEAFARARGRIRSLMAKRQSWRVTPELRFHLDESIDNAERIDRALKADAARLFHEDELAEDEAVEDDAQFEDAEEPDEAEDGLDADDELDEDDEVADDAGDDGETDDAEDANHA